MKRILKCDKHLRELLAQDDNFHVGLLFEDVAKNINIEKYGISKSFRLDQQVIPNALGSVTKQNINGKFVRKQPEEKIIKTVHIKYTRKKDGRLIEFDRNFDVYVKEMSHRFNIGLKYVVNKHNQKILIAPMLKFTKAYEDDIRNCLSINLFLEIFGQFEIYTNELEPAIAFTHRYQFDVLPKGTFEDKDIEEYVEGARRFLKNDEEVRAYQRRLQILKSYNPEIRGGGLSAFMGYIVFGFEKLGVVLLESMYANNATYVFDLKNHESLIVKNKQEVIKNKLYKKRIMHYGDWDKKIDRFLSPATA